MMKTVTIKDLYKQAKRNGESLLGLSVEKSVVEARAIAEVYNTIHTDIDRRFSREQGMFSPAYNVDDCIEDDLLEEYAQQDDAVQVVLEEFQQTVQSYLNSRAVDYRHIFNVQTIDYNPIDNYNMVEQSTDKHEDNEQSTHVTGEQSNENSYGAQSSTNTRGGVTVTNESGERTTSNDYGEQSRTNTSGERESVAIAGMAGFNSSDFQNSTKSTNTEDAHTDSENTAAHSDTSTQSAFTDTQKTSEQLDTSSVSAHTDTSKMSDRTDTDSRSSTVDITHELTRSGNVGVTTTQEMIQSEIKLWSSYDFWGKFLESIITNFCTYHDDGYSTLQTPLMNELFPFL